MSEVIRGTGGWLTRFGGRRVFGYPSKLAINGHEYNRRRRRRAR